MLDLVRKPYVQAMIGGTLMGVAGAVYRTCAMESTSFLIPMCSGETIPLSLSSGSSSAHCAGCVTAVAGGLVFLVGAIGAIRRGRRQSEMARAAA